VAEEMLYAAQKPRAKMHGALPRIRSRGTPPETPPPFRSEDLRGTRERRPMQRQNLSSLAALCSLPFVGPERTTSLSRQTL